MALHSRREFLEQSMLAAAAAVASQATAPLWGAETRAVGPNDTLRIAVIGVRGQGGSHLGGYERRSGCEVAAICDVDEAIGQTKGVERIEKNTGKKPKYYRDIRKLLEDKEIDAVSIATPNHWHALAAIWAMQAGKDVYVEKPVSHNVSEGRRMVETARKYEKICQTGTQCRSQGGTIQAIEYVKAGKIGEVKLARGLCYKRRNSIGPRGVYSPPPSVDYDLWCGPAPLSPLTRVNLHYDWHWQWETGNGDLGNQGIHQMDVARWGLGVSDVGQSVFSYGGRLGYEDAGETANTQVCIHNYGDKTLVFEVRGLETTDYRGANVGVVFHGSQGYVVLTSYDAGAAFDLDGKMIEKFQAGGDHFGNFVKAVRSRKKEDLAADILEGHLSSALCHLGNISYRLGEQVPGGEVKDRLQNFAHKDEVLETFGRVAEHLGKNKLELDKIKLQFGALLPIDSKTETFTGPLASRANPLLTREYRKPFVVPSSADV